MFVFGEQARSSRPFGLPAVLALAVIAAMTIAAVRWHPGTRPKPVARAAQGTCVPYPPGLNATTTISGTAAAELLAMVRAQREADTRECRSLLGQDPDRDPAPTSAAAAYEAVQINTGVQAAVCSSRTACAEAFAGRIRDALRDLGYPGAEVRQARYAGEAPQYDDIVYGVPLHTGQGCLVSYARAGLGVAPMTAVGTLKNGRCLH